MSWKYTYLSNVLWSPEGSIRVKCFLPFIGQRSLYMKNVPCILYFLLLSVAVVIIFLLTLTILKPDIFLLRREVEEEFFWYIVLI